MVLFRTWTSLLGLYCRLKSDLKGSLDRQGNNFASHTNHIKGNNSNDRSCVNNSSDSRNESMDGMLDSLSFCVEKKMCDLQWEVRDTAVDFLTGLMNSEGTSCT